MWRNQLNQNEQVERAGFINTLECEAEVIERLNICTVSRLPNVTAEGKRGQQPDITFTVIFMVQKYYFELFKMGVFLNEIKTCTVFFDSWNVNC